MPELSFAERVKQLRRQLGLTQTGLAALLGVRSQSVSNWEVGRVTPWRFEDILQSLERETQKTAVPAPSTGLRRERIRVSDFI